MVLLPRRSRVLDLKKWVEMFIKLKTAQHLSLQKAVDEVKDDPFTATLSKMTDIDSKLEHAHMVYEKSEATAKEILQLYTHLTSELDCEDVRIKVGKCNFKRTYYQVCVMQYGRLTSMPKRVVDPHSTDAEHLETILNDVKTIVAKAKAAMRYA